MGSEAGAGRVAKLPRRVVGVAAVLCLAVGFAFPGAGEAQAKVRCWPVGYTYPNSKFFYSIAGIRCDKQVFKLVASGYLHGYGNPPFWELRKSCRNARFCLAISPNFRNPPGRQKYRLVFASGFKEHWYSIPTYKGFNQYFYF